MVLAPAPKQRSKIYLDSEGDFEVVQRIDPESPRVETVRPAARPSLHLQVLGEDNLAASSIDPEAPDLGDVTHTGDGRIVYQSDIGIEGRTSFTYTVTVDGTKGPKPFES